MDSNQEEIGLLHESPGELIVKYQPIVLVIVRMFMRSGYFRGEEPQEVIQSVNEKLLDRIERIRSNYNGISRLRTYFSAVIRNLCLERIRKGRVEEVYRLMEEQENSLSYSPDQLNRLIIRQELERLDTVLKLLYTQRHKIVLILKALLRIPAREEEVRLLLEAPVSQSLEESVAMLVRGDFRSDREAFQHLSRVFNFLEGKQNSEDSIRKWIYIREGEIIQLLNGDPPRANHNHETLRILFDRYFHEMQPPSRDFRIKTEASVRDI
ncbi:MAG TPA: sigma-70 family RNA polymerase sigma factor [Bacteroidales bacterium]|nr:sigma-70 family RNA polymerase sigma factor [Bacteroidales bacterium]HSA44768.1 sigma-70 family RNA polymerase sigma factor [Bacteroidales bacterium]